MMRTKNLQAYSSQHHSATAQIVYLVSPSTAHGRRRIAVFDPLSLRLGFDHRCGSISGQAHLDLIGAAGRIASTSRARFRVARGSSDFQCGDPTGLCHFVGIRACADGPQLLADFPPWKVSFFKSGYYT